MYHNVCCSSICNSQDMEATSMSINRRTDKEAVVHIHKGILAEQRDICAMVTTTCCTWLARVGFPVVSPLVCLSSFYAPAKLNHLLCANTLHFFLSHACASGTPQTENHLFLLGLLFNSFVDSSMQSTGLLQSPQP